MKDNLSVVLITVALFVAGLFTGVWTQKVKPMPPPSMPALGEFGRGSSFQPSPEQMREMQQRMESLKPEMEAFQEKLKAIHETSSKKIESLLRPDQKARFEQMMQRQRGHAPSQPPMGGPDNRSSGPRGPQEMGPMGGPPSGPSHGPMQGPSQPPMMGMEGGPGRMGPSPMGPHGSPMGGGAQHLLGLIVYKPMLERMTEELGLDSRQQSQVEEILRQRRQDLLNLVDATPPPSLKLGKKPGGPQAPSEPQKR